MKGTVIVIIAAALACSLAAGCATTGIETTAEITAEGYKPMRGKGRNDIDLYSDGPPRRPYREVATIKALGTDRSKEYGLVEAMKIEAARIGADALMDIKFASEPVAGGPTGGMTCPTWQECYYIGGDSVITSRPTGEATAIVYIEDSGPETRNPGLGKEEEPEKKKGPE